ncbi:MAG: small subunit ribosomal protein [Patescibacteria group bacterium]|jgi:small subunit ribosomal protein S18|nr:small subunit ribosomal protein [Patescibacteria group bacterium]
MKQCYFCTNNIKDVDYKEVEVLKNYLDTHSRILRHSRTGTCSKHQRRLGLAVKRARFMALLPFVQG